MQNLSIMNVVTACSRSQCIINIRSMYDGHDAEAEVQLNAATLTFVDIAGAEREKRTGNQVKDFADAMSWIILILSNHVGTLWQLVKLNTRNINPVSKVWCDIKLAISLYS